MMMGEKELKGPEVEAVDDEDSGSSFDWEQGWETMARVSLAGFVGALVGLAKDQHQMQQRRAAAVAPRRKKKEETPAKKEKRPRRRPPQYAPRQSMGGGSSRGHQFLGMWSLSCMLFAIVLESFRRSSPTSLLLEYSYDSDSSEGETTKSSTEAEAPDATFANEGSSFFPLQKVALAKRHALAALGDYTLGGTVAGLAGAVAQRRRTPVPGFTFFGVATGMGLGFLAGTVQAAINIGNLYAEEQQQQKLDEQEESDDADGIKNKEDEQR